MNGTNEILEELRSLSPSVAAISRQVPYVVPEGYFTNFPALALGRVVDWKDSKSLTYSVPEGYFDGLAEGILARIGRVTPYQAPEGFFGELSPLLAVIRDKTPYAVPEGYFETFPAVVTARTEQMVARDTGKGKVVSLGNRVRRSAGWMKYSAAAVVAGLIFTVGWLRWHQPPGSGSKSPAEIANNLSKVSDAELQNFLTDQDTTLAQPL